MWKKVKYDINAILEKAKKTQDVDYEKERLKKVHDTQYDILKKLNIAKLDDNSICDLQEELETLLTNNKLPYDLQSELWDNTEKIYHNIYEI